jgi:hypothetical protein
MFSAQNRKNDDYGTKTGQTSGLLGQSFIRLVAVFLARPVEDTWALPTFDETRRGSYSPVPFGHGRRKISVQIRLDTNDLGPVRLFSEAWRPMLDSHTPPTDFGECG